ncbi:ABC transporter ATP-binding protein [Patiriisocius hiemis]|uniref:ABC transporter ATP-binding protein n=1 Tax=Patiriisocius hiemis TaxID=3075604 RepID=A0ABU2YFL6_9FLAO|nr:ABC transporter ATP-binding protein [Constantimarinum sp. W242]MDT0556015.1 ABC transporter ATP-binding protein [Constantimarinum sp. W242]
MSIILKAENISKQYRLGLVGTGTLKHDFNRFWHRIRGKEDPYLKVGGVNDRTKKATEDYVWALQDINFEVEEGEVLGIIGKNGAGKSTLLKILSQVTSPTTGTIKSRGRIASLLEVGTGFHPELTGRENIYLNGAILGMTKAEIASKIDEIIDFSGCELYIDTPTKRYSSGMTVRLAFAVAAHLEPDIMVIDEVLAVGDAEFQKKAVGKMQDISRGQGRTVLFVSHNMAAVKSLCTRCIVLDNGGLAFNGHTDEAIDFYLKLNSSNRGIRNNSIFNPNEFEYSPHVRPVSISVGAVGKALEEPIEFEDEIEFKIQFNKLSENIQIDTTLQIKDSKGNYVISCGSGLSQNIENKNETGTVEHSVRFPSSFFSSEEFFVNVLFVENKKTVTVKLDDIISFQVLESTRKLGEWMGKSIAPIKIKLDWFLSTHD